jgi:hypothetical protein
MATLTAAIDMAALTAAIDMAARSACELRDSLSHDGRTTPTSGPASGSASRLTSESGFGDPTR